MPTTQTAAPPHRASAAQARILESATALFARNGYNGVSTRDIASIAQVNEITIYRHFPRKLDLYLAVLERGLQQMCLEHGKLTELASAPNRDHALKCAAEVIHTTLTRRPDLTRLLQLSVLDVQTEVESVVRKYMNEVVEVLSHHLRRCSNDGEPTHADPTALVLALFANIFYHQTLHRYFASEQSA
jgi:AcrR family transcriptional regulator